MDIVSGPYWYAGPNYTERHEYYPAKPFDIANYSDNFFTFTYDVNGDGWTDIVVIGFPGAEAWWFENPKGKEGNWEKHLILKTVDDESPTFADITGDGKPEIIWARAMATIRICRNSEGRSDAALDVPSDHAEARLSTIYARHGDRRCERRQSARLLREGRRWWEQPEKDSEG